MLEESGCGKILAMFSPSFAKPKSCLEKEVIGNKQLIAIKIIKKENIKGVFIRKMGRNPVLQHGFTGANAVKQSALNN